MKKENRLVREADFARLFERGKSWSDPLLVLRALPNGLAVTRFGFSVGKRVGNAVTRNRVKRLMRESARLTPVRPGWDVVLIGRKPAASASFHEVRESVQALMRRAGLTGETSLDRLPESLRGGSSARSDEEDSALPDSCIPDDGLAQRAAVLSLCPELLAVRLRGHREAWISAGRLDDGAAHRPLQSAPAWRV